MAKSEVFNLTVIFGEEDSYGTLNSSGDGVKIPIISHSLSIGQNNTEVNEFDGKYVTPDDIKGNFTGSGSIVLRMRPKSFGYFLKWYLGTPSTTGSSPYTHTFTANSGAVKSIQMEVGRTDVDAGSEFELFKGLIIDSIDSPVQVDGQLQVTINVQSGKKQSYSASSAFTGTVTDLTTEAEVFNALNGTLSAGTTFTANDVSYTQSRNTELFNGIGDNGESSDFYRGVYGAEGSATFIFANKDVMAKALADTADNISIGATSGSNSVTFNNPTIKWLAGNQTPDSGSIQQLATMNFRSYGSLNTVLVNTQASY